MLSTISDYVSILSGIRKIIEAPESRSNSAVLSDIRPALRHLYFSEKTIEKLMKLEISDIGDVAISQRDNRFDVQNAFEVLIQTARDDGASIKFRRLIESIVQSKTTIRREIARQLHQSISENNTEDSSNLIQEIRTLNKSIEEVDNSIGGLLI